MDDLAITGGNNGDIDMFMAEMPAMFKMSDLGFLHYYLSLEVT